MSITGALNNALTGLSASARAAQITASNLSNALTPGYGRRELDLISQSQGATGGVRITGTTRHVDAGLIADRRMAGSNHLEASSKAAYHNKLELLVGLSDAPGSLSQRFADFESALVAASSRPDEQVRLDHVATAAEKLTDRFRDISTGIQAMREQADTNINQMVHQLNASLEQVEKLNIQITKLQNSPDDALSLLDSRQRVIDDISNIVPVRVVARDNGAVALFSAGGAILIDGPAPTLEFTPTPTIAPHFSTGNGLLSGISINGHAVNVDPNNGPLIGGDLAAQFAVRDELSVSSQATLDGLALDVISRFQDPALDPTLGATDAGLFTDQGSVFVAGSETGISGRIELNALVSQNGANETWRIRAGLGAATSGATGDATLINTMITALADRRTPASSEFGTTPRSVVGLIGNLSTRFSTEKYATDRELGFLSNQLTTLEERELSLGVDSDQEMQRLLLIEQSYAANAKMIETVDELIQTLLRI